MTRGDQRERDRARAQARAKKTKGADNKKGGSFLQRKEADAKALQDKLARKAAQQQQQGGK